MVKRTCGLACLLLAFCLSSSNRSGAQENSGDQTFSGDKNQLQVNWIYGAYVPKDSPLLPLSNHQRVAIYLKQTFTSPGIYVKTGLFAIGDEISGSPPQWNGAGGYARRVASRYGQFAIQNSISMAGNMMLRYEPRYDRCRCDGFWPRTGHAVLRNFVTYNQTESSMRPQFASYGAALAAGAISSTWKPRSNAWAEGYRSVFTQIGFGMFSNWLGEFAPDILRVIHKPKPQVQQDNSKSK
jgi:hypothetical protein